MTTISGPHATRRLILQGAAPVALIGLGNLPFAPARAAANDKYPEEAFRQKNEADAIKSLYGKTAEPSDKVSSISFFVAENPNALAASYRIPDGTIPAVANRLKMAKTTRWTAIVEADGKLYSASKEVKVTVGGCGG